MRQHQHTQRRGLTRGRTLLATGIASLFLAGCGGSDDSDTPAQSLRVSTVSSMPEYVSGGDALVEIAPPAGATGTPVVTLDGRDVSAAFKATSTGTYLGKVEGMAVGEHTLAARMGEATGSLTLTNYPVTGPMISGPHESPYVCATATFAGIPVGSTGLGNPLDANCSVPTRVTYVYRSTAAGRPVVAWAPPTTGIPTANPVYPADMEFLVMDGTNKRVPYLVRVETGTINRSIYQSIILHDPLTEPAPSPTTRPANWNGKLMYPLGGGCQGGWYMQGSTVSLSINDTWFKRGYAAVTSTLNTFGTNCNDLLSSETVAMTKERFTEAYGKPTYTIGTGGSGGAYQSYQTSDNYPGLFDGIIVNQVFPDVTTATIFKIFDSRLLNNYFNTSGRTFTVDQKKAISGYLQVNQISNMSGSAARLDPVVSFPAGFPNELKYNPTTNPTGTRATVYDHTVNVYGKDARGFAQRPIDNVGVQYGLKALLAGAITVDDFLDLNARIGGLDPDMKPQTARTTGDLGAIRRAYQSGRILNGGGGLATTAIIDRRDYFDDAVGGDIHQKIHSYSVRERLTKANGNFDNHVIVGPGNIQDDTLGLMDTWLSGMLADTSAAAKREKLIKARPAALVDACWIGTTKVIEPSTAAGAGQCNTAYPAGTTPRLVAGGPLADDIVKCQLKPVNLADYAPVTFTDAQAAALRATFAAGVCDWSKPGVEQQGLKSTWASFGPSKKNLVFDITNPTATP